MNIKGWIKYAGSALVCASMLTACSFGGSAPSVSGTAAIGANAKTVGYAEQMNKTKIMSFSINVDEAKWQQMLDQAADEQYVSADVTINGTTVKNVGIRPKGNSSLRQVVNDDTTDRYSFKIKFDEYVQDQTWMGLDKIVLNNMFSDNSYLKEYLSYDIMSYIGVDAPLYAFADIKVNGETWGFYLAVEDIDSGYLARIKDDQDELYKPNNDNSNMMGAPAGQNANPPQAPAGNGAPANVQPQPGRNNENRGAAGGGPGGGGAAGGAAGAPGGWQGGGEVGPGGGGRGMGMNGSGGGVSLQYTDDAISSYSAIFDNAETKTTEADHQRVITALKNLNAGTDLEKYVDVDDVLRYFAAHTVVVNMDSYTSNMAHNYYLYENDGQISILPWDYNMAFGGFQSGSASDVVNLAIDTPLSGVSLADRPMLGKLLEVPAYKEKYHGYLQDIMDGYFAEGKFAQTVAGLDQLISDYVKNDPSAFNTHEQYQTAVAELTKLGELRATSIQGQLNGEIPSTTDGQKAEPGKLIDASSVDLSKLGSNGRGGPGGGGNGRGAPGEFPGNMGQGGAGRRG